jgi:phosphatidylglycerophosphatase C
MSDGLPATVAVQPATEATVRVVLFDFDGVLMHGDAFARFVRSRFRRSWWRLLIALVMLPPALPLFAIRSLRMTIVGAFVRVSLLGIGPSRFETIVRAFALELAERPHVFIRAGISAMRRHRVDGDRVVIVTGCEETLVRAIFESIGLHDIEIVASRLRKGWLGMRKETHNFGKAKPVQIARHGIAGPWDIAYSDSANDIPMLKGARDPVLVNADTGTVLRVERALGRETRKVDWF